jgi:hypothetical protein
LGDWGWAWCQAFADDCLAANGVPWPGTAYVPTAVAWAQRLGVYEPVGAAPANLEPGDVLVFQWDAGPVDHTGFVLDVQGGGVRTVEGNSTGGLCRINWWPDMRSVEGRWRPAYAQAGTPSAPPLPAPPAAPSGTLYQVRLANGVLLPAVRGASDDVETGMAGIYGAPIACLAVEATEYRVRYLGGGWETVANRFDWADHEHGYAGTPGRQIEGIAVQGKTCRVHTLGGGWLPWVSGYDPGDDQNGWAGWYGSAIDMIQIQ